MMGALSLFNEILFRGRKQRTSNSPSSQSQVSPRSVCRGWIDPIIYENIAVDYGSEQFKIMYRVRRFRRETTFVELPAYLDSNIRVWHLILLHGYCWIHILKTFMNGCPEFQISGTNKGIRF